MRRRVLRPSQSTSTDSRRQLLIERRRIQLERDRVLFDRLLARLRRTFHALEKQQRRIGRLQRRLLDLPLVQAAQNVVPVAVTAAESVERLRSWASGRCLAADQPGIYRREGGSTGSRRRVSREPSDN